MSRHVASASEELSSAAADLLRVEIPSALSKTKEPSIKFLGKGNFSGLRIPCNSCGFPPLSLGETDNSWYILKWLGWGYTTAKEQDLSVKLSK